MEDQEWSTDRARTHTPVLALPFVGQIHVEKITDYGRFYFPGGVPLSNFYGAMSHDGQYQNENAQKALFRRLASFVRLLHSMWNTVKKILIVDSNDAFRESIRAFIKGLGHEVFEAATGPDAMEKASSIHPDLIIMDVRLPGMNGDEVTARLKKNMSTRNIPVVIESGWTTACNVEERISRALIAGAAEVLYKPFQLPMLRDVLRTYLLA
jgi:two-component system, cell cycle response regulator DivK